MEEQELNIKSNLDNKDRAYATGRRKNSIARVWLKRGSGEIKINGKLIDKYFTRPVLQMTGLKTERTRKIINDASKFRIFPIA